MHIYIIEQDNFLIFTLLYVNVVLLQASLPYYIRFWFRSMPMIWVCEALLNIVLTEWHSIHELKINASWSLIKFTVVPIHILILINKGVPTQYASNAGLPPRQMHPIDHPVQLCLSVQNMSTVFNNVLRVTGLTMWWFTPLWKKRSISCCRELPVDARQKGKRLDKLHANARDEGRHVHQYYEWREKTICASLFLTP